MTKSQILTEKATAPGQKRRGSLWTWITLLFIVLIVAAMAMAMMQQIEEAPAREAAVRFPSGHILNLEFSTFPNPALPTGTVQLKMALKESGGGRISVEQVSYEWGLDGQAAKDRGVAQKIDGSTFQGGAQFPAVGNWWVKIKVVSRGEAGEVTFKVPVRPAQ